MWAQIRYVVGIDQRVCRNEGTSIWTWGLNIYTQLSESRSFFFVCVFLPILQSRLLAYSDKAVDLIKSELAGHYVSVSILFVITLLVDSLLMRTMRL